MLKHPSTLRNSGYNAMNFNSKTLYSEDEIIDSKTTVLCLLSHLQFYNVLTRVKISVMFIIFDFKIEIRVFAKSFASLA